MWNHKKTELISIFSPAGTVGSKILSVFLVESKGLVCQNTSILVIIMSQDCPEGPSRFDLPPECFRCLVFLISKIMHYLP